MKPDNRLKAIAAMVPFGKSVADIGTDHAYLPVYLIKNGQINRAIAADINKGPYLAAKKTVAAAGLEDRIAVRLGSGLAVVLPGETDVLVIAGMGGGTIVGILAERPDVAASFERLIIQPMADAAEARRYFIQNGWKIVEEDLVLSEDKEKIYQVIAAEKGVAAEPEPILYEIGPLVWEKRHPLLKIFLAEQLNRLKNAAASMEKSPAALNTPKYHAYLKKIKEMEERLLCL